MGTSNKEQNLAHYKAWQARMTDEERKAYYRNKYYKNKAKYNAQSTAWGKANPHKRQAAVHQNTIAKKYPYTFSKSDITTAALADWLLENRNKPCPFCAAEATHIDHKTSLAKGGQHTWDNIWMICRTCNVAKGNLSVAEYVQWIQGLIKNFQAAELSTKLGV